MEESLNARGPEGKKSVPGDNLCSAKKNDCKLNIEAGGDSDEWETDYSASSGEGAEGEAGGWDPKSEHENQLRMKTSNEMSPSKPRGRSDENKIVIKTDTEGKEKDAARVSSGPYLPEDDADMFLCSTPKKGQSHKPGGRGKQKRQRKKVVATSGAISKRRKMIESSQKSAAQKIPLFLEGADDQQDSSSSEDALCVDESAGNEEHVHIDKSVDKTIEEHAIKNNLTANNVKSILRSLITHELVQTMLRNSLASMSEDQDETVFEPKLTRSKMKQVLQKGNDTNLWPVSPAKLGRPSATGPSILDVDFTDEEDEEDDEYQPDKDAEDLESDEESVTSSQVSDIGSPAPSTPQTPRTPVRSSSSMASTPVNKSNESLASPMGPPLPPGNRPVSKLAQQFKSSMKALEDSQNEQDVIAGRTRSKLPLTATSLYDIEEAFVAPDITPDMYDTFCDDTDWQDFLKGLQKCSGSDVQNESVEIGDDEQNDPEFNYLAEAETEELDKEDFRFDKPFRIPRKELNELMEELDELFNEENEFSVIGLCSNLASTHQQPSKKNTSSDGEGTPAPPELVQVTEDQMQQIEEQMRKHVQLTCQMYVLAQGSSDYKGMAQECHKMIMELNLFRDISVVGTQSVYNVCNLVPAVELVNRDVDWDSEIRAQSENQTCPNTGSNTVSVEALSTGTGKAQQLGEASKTMLQSSEGSVRQEALPDRVVDSSQSQVSRTQNSRCSAVRAISKSSGTGLREEGSPAEDLPGCSSKKARPRSLRSYRVKLSEVQMREIWHSPVFMYPALLPTTGLLPRSVPQSVHFTLSEDRLIAIGLDQFSKLKNPASFIQRLMMPCKTVNQIKAHIKNMSAQRFVRPNNPIKYYREHGKLRAVTHLVEKFSPSMMKAPKDQPEVLLPLWCKNYRDQLRREENKRWATEQLQLLKEKSTEKRGKGRKRQKEQNSASSSSCSEDDASGENSDVPMETLETLRMKLKPRVKRHKIIMKKRQSRRDRESISGAYSSTPITVLPSTSGSPNAIITSSGIFVPIHLASPTRMNSALASTAVKPSMSSSKKVLTTHQLLGIGTCGTGRETVNEADITAALPGSLRELRDTVQKEGVSQKHAQEGMTESEGQTERSCDSCQHHMPDSSVECCDTSHQVTSQVVQDRAPVGDTAALTKIEAGGDGVSTGCNELEGNVGAVTCRSSTSEVASMDILQMAVKGILDSPVKRAIVPVLLSVGVDHSGGIVSSPAVDNLQDEEIFGTKMTTGASKITASQNVEHGENRAGDMSSCLSYSGGNCSDIPHDDQERAAHSESAEVCHSCDVTSLPVSSSTPAQTVQMLSEGCHVSSSTPAADRITWSAAETQPARPAPVRVKPAPATVPHTSWSSLSSVCATSDVEVMFPVIVSDGEDTVCSTVGVEITNTSTSTQPQGTGAPAAAAQTAAGKPQSENSVQGNFASTSFPSPSLMQAQNERSPTKSGRRMSPSLTDSPVVIQDTEVPQSSDEDIQHQPVSAALSSEVHNPQTQVSLSTSVSSLQNLAPSVFVVASSSQALSLASFSGRPTVTTPSTFSVSAIPVTPPTATQKHVLEKTSTKYSPAKRPIAPKPGPVNCSPQIDIEKRRSQRRIVSPKKQLLQQQVRAILPKGYIYEMKMTSPTKAAARSLKRKATLICQRGSPNKPLLPLTAEIAQTNVSRPVTRGLTSSLTSQIISLKVPWTRRGAHLAGKKRKPRVVEKKPAEVKTVPEPEVEDPGQDESDETASEVDEGAMLSQEDSQTEEDADGGDEEEGYVSELMAASTTIGFNPHKKFTPDKDDHRSKAEIRREQKLAVLAPDVVDIDPRKDERDTAYAQAYVNKVKLAMQKDPDTYARFMELLCQFEKQDTSPVQVYKDVCQLLHGYPDLLDDFASFLSPGQALRSGCNRAHQEAEKARILLRKLELHFEKSQPQYQRVLRLLARWDNKTTDPATLHRSLLPLLRSVPVYLLDEIRKFFPQERPPESNLVDFEDVALGDSDGDDNMASPDEFEEIELAEENDPYRTKRCPCSCHTDSTCPKRLRGVAHCMKCSLRVYNGRLYFQPGNDASRRPACVTFHDPVPMPAPPVDRPPSIPSCNCHHRSSAAVTEDTQDEDEDDDEDDDDEEEEMEDDECGEKTGMEADSESDIKEEEEETVREDCESQREEGEQERCADHSSVMTQLAFPRPQPGVVRRPWNHMSRMRKRVMRLKPRRGQCVNSVTSSAQLADAGIVSVTQQLSVECSAAPSSPASSVLSPSQAVAGRSHPMSMISTVDSVGSCVAAVAGVPQIRPTQSGLPWSTAHPSSAVLSSDGGAVSFPGPDNTVIMFNSALSARGHNLPSRQDQRKGLVEQGACVASENSATSVDDAAVQQGIDLPTLPSPGKNMRQGSFAGLLPKTVRGGTTGCQGEGSRVPTTCPQDTGRDADQVAFCKSVSLSPPSLSQAAVAALLEQYGDDATQSNMSFMVGLSENSNPSSDLLAKAMKFARIKQGDTRTSSTIACEQPPFSTDLPIPGQQMDAADCATLGESHKMEQEDTAWLREEDKLILEVCQQHGPSEETFVQIASQLPHRTPHQAASRFCTLMSLVSDPESEEEMHE